MCISLSIRKCAAIELLSLLDRTVILTQCTDLDRTSKYYKQRMGNVLERTSAISVLNRSHKLSENAYKHSKSHNIPFLSRDVFSLKKMLPWPL